MNDLMRAQYSRRACLDDACRELLERSERLRSLSKDDVLARALRDISVDSASALIYIAAKHIRIRVLAERQPAGDVTSTTLGLRRNCAFSMPYVGVALSIVTS